MIYDMARLTAILRDLSTSTVLESKEWEDMDLKVRRNICISTQISGTIMNLRDVDCFNRRPLHYAAMNGHHSVVALLLERGAELDAQDGHGNTPLMLASCRGHLESARELLNFGANTEKRGRDGSTALILASLGGYPDVVSLLIEKGANINAQDKYGNTAVGLASSVVVSGMLLKRGLRARDITPAEFRLAQRQYLQSVKNNTPFALAAPPSKLAITAAQSKLALPAPPKKETKRNSKKEKANTKERKDKPTRQKGAKQLPKEQKSEKTATVPHHTHLENGKNQKVQACCKQDNFSPDMKGTTKEMQEGIDNDWRPSAAEDKERPKREPETLLEKMPDKFSKNESELKAIPSDGKFLDIDFLQAFPHSKKSMGPLS